jgi:maleate cis-trans isomerase
MYGWRARIGNISPTACSEILPYEFYRVAPEGVTFVSTNLVIRDARESSQVEASWHKFDTAFEDLLHTRVDHITLSGAPLVLANGVDRHRELLNAGTRWHQPTVVCRRAQISRRREIGGGDVIHSPLITNWLGHSWFRIGPSGLCFRFDLFFNLPCLAL